MLMKFWIMSIGIIEKESVIDMIFEWRKSWKDSDNFEVCWCLKRNRSRKELSKIKEKLKKEYNYVSKKDFEIIWNYWINNRDITSEIVKPKTEEEWKKSVLCINDISGWFCFSENKYKIPTIENNTIIISDYSKLRILYLVKAGKLNPVVVDWIFRNELITKYRRSLNLDSDKLFNLGKILGGF